MDQHPCGTFLTHCRIPQRIQAVLEAKEGSDPVRGECIQVRGREKEAGGMEGERNKLFSARSQGLYNIIGIHVREGKRN